MTIAQSRVTAQGQISVPAEVRKRLGVGPGSVLEWDDEAGNIVVRKASRFTSTEIHAVLFGPTGNAQLPVDVKEAIRKRTRQRHARG